MGVFNNYGCGLEKQKIRALKSCSNKTPRPVALQASSSGCDGCELCLWLTAQKDVQMLSYSAGVCGEVTRRKGPGILCPGKNYGNEFRAQNKLLKPPKTYLADVSLFCQN